MHQDPHSKLEKNGIQYYVPEDVLPESDGAPSASLLNLPL
jgi:hypothetical protein